MVDRLKKHWLRIVAHIVSLMPFALLLWDLQHDNLTANPIEEATLRTGKAALTLLVLSLACTPLNTLFGLRQALPLRRPLGLYAFCYACIHLIIFVYVDYGLDLELLQEAVLEKRYALVGLAAFLMLLPLALTSTRGWMRRLGQRWKKLHRLVYVAAGLAVVHFLWLVKADIREPLIYGAVVATLMLLRLPHLRRAFITWRQRRAMPPPPAKPAD
jgi:sulfoxide reductase heme-binding subunit YedZ